MELLERATYVTELNDQLRAAAHSEGCLVLLGGELERLPTEHAPAHRLFRAFLANLTAAPRPTLLVVEDAHWADEATLDLLRYLGRRIGPIPSLMIVTYRDDEVGPQHRLRLVMGDLATAEAVRRLTLQPLSEEGVRLLAAGSPLDPAALYRQTGGNPFYVTEVLAVGGRGIPPTVHDAVLARVARLSAGARSTPETGAVIGLGVAPGLLAEIDGLNADAVEECLATGLLQASDGALAFRHELARAAVLEAMSPVRAAALHQKVLTALLGGSVHPDDFARLAHHADAAGDQTAVLTCAPAAGAGPPRSAPIRKRRPSMREPSGSPIISTTWSGSRCWPGGSRSAG